MNRYRGWYTDPGDISTGPSRLSDGMDAIHQKYAKPPMLTEFSTEYQAELVIRTIEVLRQKPYVIGEHV